jgi:hypothetical protein
MEGKGSQGGVPGRGTCKYGFDVRSCCQGPRRHGLAQGGLLQAQLQTTTCIGCNADGRLLFLLKLKGTMQLSLVMLKIQRLQPSARVKIGVANERSSAECMGCLVVLLDFACISACCLQLGPCMHLWVP